MSEEIPELKQYNIPEIKGFDIVGYIGKGTWTPVFKAIKKTDGSEWALKFYRPSELGQKYVEDGGWTEEEFWNKECQNGKTPVHQNIAFNSLETADNGETFLAEVYVGDRFLDQYLEQVGTPALDEIVDISRGMSEALEVQHTKAGGEGRAHGDFAPKNMAYGLDRIIKLSDFGTSTIGERANGNRGYPEIRALEQFSTTKCPSKKGDVFSFGSILYKMFTGKYAFEDELEKVGEKHMSYLAENPEIWNTTIDKKVNDEQIPKQFRNLLKRCLYAPEKVERKGFWSRILPSSKGRIEDGVELKKELDKAIKSYEASKTRWKKYAAAAAVVLAVGGAITAGVDDISSRFNQKEKELMYEKKGRLVKLFEEGATRAMSDDWHMMLDHAEFQGFRSALRNDGITDKYVHYLAYLNPELTYEMIQETGEKTWDGLNLHIYDRDGKLWEAMLKIIGGGSDNMARLMAPERWQAAEKRWSQIKDDYKRRKELEKRRKEFPRGGHGLGWMPESDEAKPVTDGYYETIKATKERIEANKKESKK